METTVVHSQKLYVSPEEYLSNELTREVRHEYVAGMLRPVPGSKVTHGRIVSNVSALLHQQIQGGPCEVFTNKLKVYIRASGEHFYYYPDVVVDCSNADGGSLLAPEPRVIFEVLSESTEMYDRGEKRQNYCALPSMQVYVLVWQTVPALMVYRRREVGWTLEVVDGFQATLTLPEISCTLPIQNIYKRVRFDE